jgi:hypothetical protein
VLCKMCHGKAETRRPFSQPWSPVLVRRYRDEWLARVKQERDRGTAPPATADPLLIEDCAEVIFVGGTLVPGRHVVIRRVDRVRFEQASPPENDAPGTAGT